MRKITDPRNLPYLGATVQAVLFAIAGELALPFFGWLVGLGAGAVVNYSIALASSRIDGIAQNRQPLARLALFGMWLISPAVIVLSLFMPASVWTAIAWAVCVDTAIILAGAIAGKSLIPQSEPTTPPSVAQRRSAKKKARSAEFVCRNAGAGCGRAFVSQNAANAHARTCEYKPTVSMPVEERIR